MSPIIKAMAGNAVMVGGKRRADLDVCRPRSTYQVDDFGRARLTSMTDENLRQLGEEGERTTAVRQAVDERLAYRPAELAALVGLSTKAIYRAIGRGELQAVKVANGSRLLVPATATEEWLEASVLAPRRSKTPPKGLRPDHAGRPLADALARLKDSWVAD
jgi:excisionase family DNA binding protein